MNYKCDCNKPNINKNYGYWEDREITSDEMDIIDYLKNNIELENKSILHIGIGNSFLSTQLSCKNNIVYGISVSKNEIKKGESLKNSNYKVIFCDKYSLNFKELFLNKKFDIIVDNNLKSYACCAISFNSLFENLAYILNKNGIIITSRKGMEWYKTLKPKISFNLKKLFHYKFKETEGNPENVLSLKEAKKLGEKYSLNIYFDEKIYFFKN